jgi:hypothetical protein
MLYLASPYTHKDKGVMHARYIAACNAQVFLALSGRYVYSPVAFGHAVEVQTGVNLPYEYWIRHGMRMLDKSTGVVVLPLPGWQESNGVKLEIDLALRVGKPFFRLNGISYREDVRDGYPRNPTTKPSSDSIAASDSPFLEGPCIWKSSGDLYGAWGGAG